MKREPKSKPGLPSIPGSPCGATETARKAATEFFGKARRIIEDMRKAR